MPVNFNGDWAKMVKSTNDKLIEIAMEETGHKIAIDLKEQTQREIETGQFDTVGGSTALGLKHTGEYLDSFLVGNGIKSDRQFKIEIGSISNKAVGLEYGTSPNVHKNLRPGVLIKWARDKGLADPKRAGFAITNAIKKEGTVPKPAFRRGIQSSKLNSNRLMANIEVFIKRRMKPYLP